MKKRKKRRKRRKHFCCLSLPPSLVVDSSSSSSIFDSLEEVVFISGLHYQEKKVHHSFKSCGYHDSLQLILFHQPLPFTIYSALSNFKGGISYVGSCIKKGKSSNFLENRLILFLVKKCFRINTFYFMQAYLSSVNRFFNINF